MDTDDFVLAIDDGREHLQLTDQGEWTSTIRSGMMIVMSVVMTRVYETTSAQYQRPICDCWNGLKGNNGQSPIDWLIEILARQTLRAFPSTNGI